MRWRISLQKTEKTIFKSVSWRFAVKRKNRNLICLSRERLPLLALRKNTASRQFFSSYFEWRKEKWTKNSSQVKKFYPLFSQFSCSWAACFCTRCKCGRDIAGNNVSVSLWMHGSVFSWQTDIGLSDCLFFQRPWKVRSYRWICRWSYWHD